MRLQRNPLDTRILRRTGLVVTRMRLGLAALSLPRAGHLWGRPDRCGAGSRVPAQCEAAVLAEAGAPWIGALDEPLGFLAERGWQARLSAAGEAEANWGTLMSW